MDAIAILRKLWERRLLVSFGLALAVTVGVVLSNRVDLAVPPRFENRQYEVGIASAEVLVDSPNSQVIDLGGSAARADVASLSVRARLLADLAATTTLKDRIARRAGIAPHLLIALRPSTTPFVEPTPLESGATVRTSDPRANILSMRVHEELPIIGVDAQAPDPSTAARLSNAAVEELRLYLKTAAAAGAVPDTRKLVLDPLGPARSSLSRRGPSQMRGLIAAIFFFGAWCAGIFIVSGFVRGWRQSAVPTSTHGLGVPGPRDGAPMPPNVEPVPVAPEHVTLPAPPLRRETAETTVRSGRAAVAPAELPNLPEHAERYRGGMVT